MNNELRKITLWQQYKSKDEVIKFFEFVRKRLQKYMDLFYKKDEDGKLHLGSYGREMCINSAASEYLGYYLTNVYGLERPHFLLDKAYWDAEFHYDDGKYWDTPRDVELVPIPILIKIFKWVYNYRYRVWSIPTLAYLVADFGDLPIDQVKVSYNEEKKLFEVMCTNNYNTKILNILWRTYPNVFNMPYGFNMEIDLRNPLDPDAESKSPAIIL